MPFESMFQEELAQTLNASLVSDDDDDDDDDDDRDSDNDDSSP